MKLRDFVANSLPRVRGRKKKGQVVNGTAVSITAAVVAATTAAASGSGTKATNGTTTSPAKAEAHNPKSPRPGRQDGNGNWFQFGAESRFGFLEKLVGKESPVKRLFENRNRHVVTAPKSDKRQNSRTDDDDDDDDIHIKTVSSPRYCPSSAVTEPSSPYGSVGGVRSPPLGEKPVFHSQHASPVCSSWAAHERYSDWDCSSFYTVGHGYPDSVTSFESSTPGSQRGPRSRSRIRTNPWLPSPRPSPYSVRSLSSPCPSSRSQSPSSSPAPPSSSDSTSPLTSFSSDVSATRETQLHRHRRHRRHHSEVKASDLTRHIAFETHHTDTEQYYSTLDSGIGDIATSSSEKDKHKVTTSRKQRNLNTKRRSVDRDLELVKNFTIAASSASPKSKPKFRVKARSSCPSSSSKALIANRDSKFWDSDSSSRSPPTRSRSLGNSKDSLHFETAHPERCVVSERSRAVPGTFGELVPGYLPGEFFCEADSVDFYTITGVHESSILSPCDDICVITSNIEQLAQNISSEYEDSADVSFESTLDSSKQEDKSDSLIDLYNIDSEDTLILQTSGSGVSTVLDYATFAEALQCTDSLRTESRDTLLDSTLTDASNQHVVSSEELPTVDVAVQTDFDDEEDNSSSDWLASTESSSDWVTSNGSGSEWLASGGSDWQTGEGSGCATEEEEEEEEEEESTLWVEGSRLWLVPDIMQNSTDTGYSSLSRDGRIVTDDNNNNNSHNNNNNNNNNTTTNNNNIAANTEYSSDSTTTTTTTTTADDKMSKTSDSDVTSQTASDSTKCSDIAVASGAVPKRNVIRKLPKHKPSSEMFENAGDLCSQRISCTFEFNIMDGNCSRKGALGGNQSGMCAARMKDKSEHCSWDADCSGSKDSQEDAPPEGVHRSCRRKVNRHSSYDHVVPYPYDVTRFSDVILPPEERGRSVSPCVLHDHLSSRSEEAKELEGPFQLPSTIFTSTPRNHGSEAGEEDFCSCLDTSMTSEKNDITNPEEGNFESSRASKLALVPSSKRFLPPRLFDNPPSTGRNLQQVKASLEDKVQFLRQGKRIVSRKIREAREEEMVRQQQKLRFQRLLDIHRKRILLETLQDLRQRLESQSARLQASYSAVLDLQKRYV